jgi:NhaP-type Na+/H+ or K+/H+ antiporter
VAVFVCARSIRASERDHEYHQVLHDFVEQIGRLLTVLLLVLFGGAVVRGLLAPLTWHAVALALVVVLVVRPLTGWLSLTRAPGTRKEKVAIAAFGIRGIGTFYYLAYATASATFPGAEQVWAVAGLVVIVSVVAHGVAATPIMNRLDRMRRAEGRDVGPAPGIAGDEERPLSGAAEG